MGDALAIAPRQQFLPEHFARCALHRRPTQLDRLRVDLATALAAPHTLRYEGCGACSRTQLGLGYPGWLAMRRPGRRPALSSAIFRAVAVIASA